MKNIVYIPIIAVLLLTASCQREGRVTGVRLDRNEITLNVGENFSLTATVIPADANDQTVYWTSSDPDKVSVSNDGRITGISATAAGNPVDIRVSTMEGEFDDRCKVTVLPPVITITGQPTAITEVKAGAITGALSVSASVTSGVMLKYQWYGNSTNSSSGGVPVSGATSADFILPATLSVGIYYYFCEVSATGGAASLRSNVATVYVNENKLSFDDLKPGTFTATGILFQTGQSSWTGNLNRFTDDKAGRYYTISNWANSRETLSLDFVDGTLKLNEGTIVGIEGGYTLYFRASYIVGDKWYPAPNYTVSFNKFTQTLDFSGTYDSHPVYVGLIGKNPSGDEKIFYESQVRDAKLVLPARADL